MPDNSLTLTAAELLEIGERITKDAHCLKFDGLTFDDALVAVTDRARLYAALERLVEEYASRKHPTTGEDIWVVSHIRGKEFYTKDAAICALLQGGGE